MSTGARHVNGKMTKGKRKRDPAAPFVCQGQMDVESFENEFWQHTMDVAENVEDDFKQQALPLARIKKVVKSDPEVTQMISTETTILLEKACQIFIQELSIRSQLVALDSNRRTVQAVDIVGAAGQSNVFDFLINILPLRPSTGQPAPQVSGSKPGTRSSSRRQSRRRSRDGTGSSGDQPLDEVE